MTLRIIFTVTLIVFVNGMHIVAQTTDKSLELEPGVGRELAHWRAAHYSNIRYALTVEVAPGAPMLRGFEEIRVMLDDAATSLVLDWRVAAAKEGQPQARVWEIQANGRTVTDA